ncbi:granulin a isoform X3 [Carassius auratus]|uniref:Granulin a isoform X3 n=1 Tax=Carassius auratus TaxID=7957 RepID=A0A6P6JW57_CARAU|nr:fibrillin-1-like isoform X3 [Carassius auratus]
MLKVTLGLALVTLVACSQCPNNEVCEAGQTCCQDPTGEFSCCPFHHGECCEDHLHCCPEDMLCSVMDSLCMNATHTLLFVERTPAKRTDLPKSFRMIPSLPASEDDITCPDGSFCPAEFSCLLMASSYGCCPVAQGLVCSDGKHCCAKDHECSADSNSCVKLKEPVLCGNGTSECPVDTTCCGTEDGQWACCPIPKAVCCDDKIHCCQEDSVCDVEGSKCMSSTNQELPMWAKFPARLRAEWEDHKSAERRTEAELTTARRITTAGKQMTTLPGALPKTSDVPCNDTAACPDGNTCCKTQGGGWACCPLPEAVCCDDFIHCCPHGQKCNTAAGTCEDSSGSQPWFEKMPVKLISSQNVAVTQDVPCNDTAACPDGNTCCKTKEGEWACCPLPEAVCCDDFIHCCPHGQKCNTAAGTCEDSSGSQPWFEKLPVKLISSQNVAVTQDVPCNDTAACPDGNTCCKTKEGEWACCPLPEAVCCDDFIHCCPHGQKCNTAAGTCEDSTGSQPWFEKMPVKLISSQNVAVTQVHSDVPCNDTAACPDGNTCCKTQEGEWACCPLPEAVCCDDFTHCCPHGQKCNTAAGTCEDSSGSQPWFEKMPVKLISSQNVAVTQDVPCNDTAACPDGNTCCKTKEGEWACCPLPEAVCCDDFTHCCPHGQKCNTAAGTCEDSSGSQPWFEKMPVKLISSQNVAVTQVHSDVPCNDTAACPDGNTCCKTQEGEWACCPLPEAVCCDDFIHCCPHGQKCNTAAGTCEDSSGSQPWFEKMPVKLISSQNVAVTQVHSDVPCNDTAACPDGNTCCKTKEGEWACCPLPEAVCCDDFIHCCPHGQKCNTAAGTCEDSSGSQPWFEKLPVKLISSQNVAVTQDVPCNDTAACPDGNTCCKTKEGEWACCPLPEAVCCDDFTHCCPHGQKCNTAAGTCEDSSGSQPWFEKLPVKLISSQNVAVTQDVPCNDTAACPDGNTCCKTKEGEWACCPLPEAVCCDDFTHCCPHGQKCNTAAGTCEDSTGSQPWFEKLPVKLISSQNVAVTQVHSDVPCNDTAACPDGNTCCKTQEGEWACCPLPEAVCCDDFIHCCPHGQKCNTAAGTCEDSSGSQPWFQKMPVKLISSQNVAVTQNVTCDSSKSCPDGNTCCKTKEGEWACCPLPEAVCCEDFTHCCPHGTTCNVAAGSCDEPSGSQPWSEKLPALPRAGQRSHGNVNCDSSHICPDSHTCCKNIDGDWGCCPLPEAVCCTDGEHCCPANYKCDVTRVSCIRGDVVIPWYNKMSAQSTPAPSLDLGAVECGEQMSCSADSTCCHLSTGEWGCCPLPEAVCCPDQEHCCPKGYRCDLRRRSCIKTSWLHMEKVPLAHIDDQKPQSSVTENDIQCGGGHSCKDSETCCPTSKTTWGCCPSPKAVCCDDMKHCCPAGYKCGAGGTCTSAVGFDWNNWDNWRVFFSKNNRAITL